MSPTNLETGADIVNLKPGEYGKAQNGNWYCRTPGGHLGNLAKHNVTEHDDGTITVTPSILVSEGDGKGGSVEAWHGYLTKGEWREC